MLSLAVILSLLFNVLDTSYEWSIRYRVPSGWTEDYGLRIWSDGRIVQCLDRDCLVPAVCLANPLSPDKLERISQMVYAAHAKLPRGYHLVIDDGCSDEPEHSVVIELFGGEDRGYQYSAHPACVDESEVPSWMSALTEELESTLHIVSSCVDDI